jgi:hypothetical protein
MPERARKPDDTMMSPRGAIMRPYAQSRETYSAPRSLRETQYASRGPLVSRDEGDAMPGGVRGRRLSGW